MDNDKPTPGPAADREAMKAEAPTADPIRRAPAKADKAASGPMLPVAEPFRALASATPSEKTGVFGQLVTDDGDIAGLVAYSIYKQNKLDWLSAFQAARGRAPNDDELGAYIIGEATPRRIATYRHLAEATLAGNGPGVGRAGDGPRVGYRSGNPIRNEKTALIATYALIALIFLIGFLLAAHYTMSSR